MKRRSTSIATCLLIILLSSCGLPFNSNIEEQQIQTAIAETALAEATFQSAVDQSVQATVIAMPPTPTMQGTVDPYTLTEEELAALIDAGSDEAVNASEEASQATTQITSDGTITEEEVYESVYYLYDAEAAIAYTEELIYLYYDLYGELASDTLEMLIAIEEDLSELTTLLDEIEGILTQGAQSASAAIETLNNAATALESRAGQAQTNLQAWREGFKTGLDERETQYTGLAPSEIASDRDGALLQAYSYLDAVKTAFEDRKISLEEMNLIAQLGANAQASLQQSGGPALRLLGNNIDGITRQVSRGQWPQARSGLGNFEASLPGRPTR